MSEEEGHRFVYCAEGVSHREGTLACAVGQSWGSWEVLVFDLVALSNSQLWGHLVQGLYEV